MVLDRHERSESTRCLSKVERNAYGGAQDPTTKGVVCCVESEDDDREEDAERWPPGQFMDESIEADTRRFLEEARELARRRAEELPPEEDGL
jgi:hypothetical protein